MKEYYLKSVEGKITFAADSISIIRMQNKTVIEFNQIEHVEYKVDGPYGKIFFVFKKPEIMKNIDKNLHKRKNLKLLSTSSDEDYVYHFMLSFERMYENEFKLFKDYLAGYISGNVLDFNGLDIATVQEQVQQQSEQIMQLIKQKHWENEQYSTVKNFLGNIFFIVISTIGLIALINIITNF